MLTNMQLNSGFRVIQETDIAAMVDQQALTASITLWCQIFFYRTPKCETNDSFSNEF